MSVSEDALKKLEHSRMSYRDMLDKAADDIACALVIDYLNINDYQKVTKEILTIKDVPQFDLKGLELINVIKCKKKKSKKHKKPKPVKDDWDPDLAKAADNIACQLVINYLTRHGYGNIARLVKKKKKVQEFDLQGLDLTDLLNKSKPKNDETNKRKNCDKIENVRGGQFTIRCGRFFVPVMDIFVKSPLSRFECSNCAKSYNFQDSFSFNLKCQTMLITCCQCSQWTLRRIGLEDKMIF